VRTFQYTKDKDIYRIDSCDWFVCSYSHSSVIKL